MNDNFYFLKDIDSELFSIIQDAQKLFRDEYFNQCTIQVRIFAEKMAKKISNEKIDGTFDDILNCLKDKIKTDREKEFIEDLFFIKKEGNAAAHGEEIEATRALEVIKRAFEASINYSYSKTKNEEIDKLLFDTTLLITQKPQKEEKLVDKYLELAQNQTEDISKEDLLNKKQQEFQSKTKKKTLSLTQQKIKEKVKKARKNLRQNINKKDKPKQTKTKAKTSKKTSKKQISKNFLKPVLFFIFVLFSLFFLAKMFTLF